MNGTNCSAKHMSAGVKIDYIAPRQRRDVVYLMGWAAAFAQP